MVPQDEFINRTLQGIQAAQDLRQRNPKVLKPDPDAPTSHDIRHPAYPQMAAGQTHWPQRSPSPVFRRPVSRDAFQFSYHSASARDVGVNDPPRAGRRDYQSIDSSTIKHRKHSSDPQNRSSKPHSDRKSRDTERSKRGHKSRHSDRDFSRSKSQAKAAGSLYSESAEADRLKLIPIAPAPSIQPPAVPNAIRNMTNVNQNKKKTPRPRTSDSSCSDSSSSSERGRSRKKKTPLMPVERVPIWTSSVAREIGKRSFLNSNV